MPGETSEMDDDGIGKVKGIVLETRRARLSGIPDDL